MKKVSPNVIRIYFLVAILYLVWVVTTYQNIIHMDMVFIVSTKVKDLMDHKLTVYDFFYQPIFPCCTSLIFTFLNAYFFKLNTIIETLLGTVFLIILGYKYLREISFFLSNNKQKIVFACLIAFITFGLHKWEAAFTSFFSFAVFFNVAICFFNYFFSIKYISETVEISKFTNGIGLLVFSNLLIIFEAPAYFYGYILSITIVLLLIKFFNIFSFNKKRWNSLILINLILIGFSLCLVSYLSTFPLFEQHGASQVSFSNFLSFFIQKPLWVIKFYLLANSAPYLGEAYNLLNLRALFGIVILLLYGLATYYVIKKKDSRLLVPLALIFYNIISYGFITMGRYVFNDIAYGSSSRYTAFNLSGVLGLTTILFFYFLDNKKIINKAFAGVVLSVIIIFYVAVDIRQLEISPYRVLGFNSIKNALLTGKNMGVLQSDSSTSLDAIKVLRKYKLNVYSGTIDYGDLHNITFTSGTTTFTELSKTGFYDNENGISWTNGNSSISFPANYVNNDSVSIVLTTYMPTVCKDVVPKLFLKDEGNNIHQPDFYNRTGDKFYFKFYFKQGVHITSINISSQVINAAPDLRVLSFPFISLEITH